MGLADYFRRDAVAIAQVLSGFDETAIRACLEKFALEIGVHEGAARKHEGRSSADLMVRIGARLYPAIRIRTEDQAIAKALEELARSINPNIDLNPDRTDVAVWVGPDAPSTDAPRRVYVGSSEWEGRVSTRCEQIVGNSQNGLGAGVAACVAMANVFRAAFFGSDAAMDEDLVLSAAGSVATPPRITASTDLGNGILVGGGAVGNGVVWALSAIPAKLQLNLVDPEPIEVGNLQRYVLAVRADENRAKVDVLADALSNRVRARAAPVDWERFVSEWDGALPPTMVAVDSAEARRAIQASLPEVIVNGWTQPGDLGVSVHYFDSPGACLYCLYLPQGPVPNQDEIYARALGVPDQLMLIRNMLHAETGLPQDLAAMIAMRLGVAPELLSPYVGRTIRELYVDGMCGGGVIPIGSVGMPREDVHVPLAHQSALAGVLLAAAFVLAQSGRIEPGPTGILRLNLMNPINPAFVFQVALKDPRGICICQDSDYVEAYRRLQHATQASARTPTRLANVPRGRKGTARRQAMLPGA